MKMMSLEKLEARLRTHSPFRTPFRRAIWLSLLLHVGLFGFFAFIINLFYVPRLTLTPLVFDFVYRPSDGVTTSDNQGPERESQAKKKLARPDDTPLTTVSQKPRIDRTLTAPAKHLTPSFKPVEAVQPDGIENLPLAENWVDPGNMPEDETTVNLNKVLSLRTLAPTSLKFPEYDVRNPKPLAAKVSMSRKQHKELVKKLNKLAEKLPKIEFTDTTLVWKIKGREYEVRLQQRPASSDMALDEVLVEVRTNQNGRKLSSEMRMKRLAFSSFAQFVDYWNPYVAVHNDELMGRFHSNTEFKVSNNRGVLPKFHDKVTTAGYRVELSDPNFPFFNQKSIFLAGLETGAKVIKMPKNFVPAANDTELDSSRIHVMAEECWITFERDGSYSWQTKSNRDGTNRRLLPDDQAFLILGTKDAVLHVKGTLNGQVLLYASDDIIIDSNLTYASLPEAVAFANDYLGLVSEEDVEIARPEVTGPGDLHIYASIYARDRFKVGDIYGNGEATLYIYGSLSAGSLTATEPRYATRVRFDKRLETRRPPNFPMTDRYELEDWDGYWNVKGGSSE